MRWLCALFLVLCPLVVLSSSRLPQLSGAELDQEVGYCKGVVVAYVAKCNPSAATCDAQTVVITVGVGGNIPGTSIPNPIGKILTWKWGCPQGGAKEMVAGTCPPKPHEIIDPMNPLQVHGGKINPKQNNCPNTKMEKPCTWKRKNRKFIGIPTIFFERVCIVDPNAAQVGPSYCGAQFEQFNTYQDTCM